MNDVGRWSIDDAARAAFATLSGDHNPIHTHTVAARRLHGGVVLVHGAHVLLSVIDQALATGELRGAPERITVTFRQGVPPGRTLRTSFERADSTLSAVVLAGDGRVATVALRGRGGGPVHGPLPPTPPPGVAADHDLASLRDTVGAVALGYDGAIADSLFPLAAATLGSVRIAEIARLSCLVGMHAPGLRSMSSQYEIDCRTTIDGAAPMSLRYRVTQVDARMRRVRLAVEGPSTAATVTAFSPVGPIDQVALLTGRERAHAGEFDGWRTLVVGGSRGLGAACVDLLRSGGADVRFTSRFDAPTDAAAAEVARRTGALAIRHDATAQLTQALAPGWAPTHVCWFASPPATAPLDELHRVQVESFERDVGELPAPPLRGVLWPSCEHATGLLEQTKRAGESACERLRRERPGVVVHAPRLPSMLTEASASLLPKEYADTASTLLRALRALPR